MAVESLDVLGLRSSRVGDDTVNWKSKCHSPVTSRDDRSPLQWNAYTSDREPVPWCYVLRCLKIHEGDTSREKKLQTGCVRSTNSSNVEIQKERVEPFYPNEPEVE